MTSDSHKRLCVIRDCYLDDSKDKHQEFVHVCGGFYGTSKAWDRFSKAWDKQCKEDGIDYWKTSEYRRLEGQFAKWSPDRRSEADAVKHRLQAIARKSIRLHGVAVAVPVKVHHDLLRYENADRIFKEEHIYFRALETAIYRATSLACADPRDLMLFVHDDGPDFDLLRQIFNSYKEKNQETGKHLTMFMPMDDKTTPPLQLADMFANAIQSTSVDIFAHNRMRDRKNIFMLDRSSVSVWDRPIGEIVLRHNMRSRGIPVPLELDEAADKWEQELKSTKRREMIL
jgi:hypothetical protein